MGFLGFNLRSKIVLIFFFRGRSGSLTDEVRLQMSPRRHHYHHTLHNSSNDTSSELLKLLKRLVILLYYAILGYQ